MSNALTDTNRSHFLEAIAQLPPNGGPAWLNATRDAGASLFRETDLPNTRMEEWRQTNINAINKVEWRSLLAPTDHGVSAEDAINYFYAPGAWTELVFVDGFFSKDLSHVADLPTGVTAGSLYAAMQGDAAAVVEKHLNQHLGERNAYTALNSALIQDGAFLHVPKNTQVETPIHFIFISSQREADTVSHLRNLFVLEEGAQATVLTTYVSLSDDTRYLNNIVEEVALGANAHLAQYRLVEEGTAGNHLATTEVHHDRDSRYTGFSFSLEGAVTRNQLCIALDGEGAECNLNGLYLNDGDRLIDNALRITHHKSNCRSRIAYKGVLDDKSKSVFAGYVHVVPDAQQTDSDQLSNNLLLSDEASIDTKPQLEIFADDVKCTHGATIGSFPEAILFYFRSRGIDTAMAQGMLTYGFADEVVGEIEVPTLAERMDRYVYEKYSPKFG